MSKALQDNTYMHHKDDYKTKGLSLVKIFEIDLPFWECKQSVIYEREVEPDRFSSILLKLIKNGISTHSEICSFLGIDQDCFVNIQFHYLIKNGFIRETDHDSFLITLDGENFINKKKKTTQTEQEEFEFLMVDNFKYLKNDLSKTFFDPSQPIDNNWSECKKNNFGGYEIIQSHKKQHQENIIEIPHQNKPTLHNLKEKRSSFSEFYNKRYKNKTFYDFADSNLQQYKRSIRFLGLLFQNPNDPNKLQIDIRQYRDTVKNFDKTFHKEEFLSKLVNSPEIRKIVIENIEKQL